MFFKKLKKRSYVKVLSIHDLVSAPNPMDTYF